MPTDVVIVGGGEHARVIANALLTDRSSPGLAGFVDPDPLAVVPGLNHLGPDQAVDAMGDTYLVLGVGTYGFVNTRPEVVARIGRPESDWIAVIHDSAVVAKDAIVGPGTVILANAVVGPGVRLGSHVVVNSAAIVEHDTVVGDHSILGPGVVIGGGSAIGSRVLIGMGTCVRDHVTVGDDAHVAMGSVVVGSVPPAAVVSGLPAREVVQP